MTQASESVRLIATVDAVWSEIRAAHPDVPAVLLMTAPSCGDRRAIGHFWPMKWQHRTEGDLHEVILFAEYLNRTPAEVFGTLLHEAAHACNFVRKVKDCSASQYHNAESIESNDRADGDQVRKLRQSVRGWVRRAIKGRNGTMSQTTEKTETQSAEKPGIEQIEELKKQISWVTERVEFVFGNLSLRVNLAHNRITEREVSEEQAVSDGMIEAFRMAMEWKDALRIILLPKVVLEGVKEALLGGDPALGMLRAVELLEHEALAKVKGESLAVKGTIKNLAELAKMIAAKIKDDDGIQY